MRGRIHTGSGMIARVQRKITSRDCSLEGRNRIHDSSYILAGNIEEVKKKKRKKRKRIGK